MLPPDASVPALQTALAPLDGPGTWSKVIPYVLENFAEEISLDDLAQVAGMSRFNFCRKFHRECGLTPMRWLWQFRTLLAAEFITLDPRWSLTDVAFSCGFTSSAHFSRSFRATFQKSPSTFRKDALAASTALAPVPFDALFNDNTALVLRAARAAISV
jgi:AraC-like DNA-binding protein